MYQSILIYKNLRYLKLALLLTGVAILAYALDDPMGAPNGGTWLGYTLGGFSALLVLWLMWFGIRKRRYGPGHVTLQAWLSAHVYLGTMLIVTSTLHSGFQFGLNFHTLTYGLMMVVVLSGMFGVYSYLRYPSEMTRNRNGSTLRDMLLQIADLDQQCRGLAMTLGDDINNAIFDANRRTQIGGGFIRQISGSDPSCATTAALKRIGTLAGTVDDADAGQIRQLVSILSRKVEVLKQARRDIQFQALMKIWLFIHVPFSIALLAALPTHVFVVFFYW